MRMKKTSARFLSLFYTGILLGSGFLLVEQGISGSGEKDRFDWPQWRGRQRDGVSRETGILKNWPESGPKVVWQAPSGDGYSGISVSDGRLFTMYGDAGAEVVVCLDAGSGRELWRFQSEARVYRNSFGNGPRSTPTVDGEAVYTLGATARLYALNVKNGDKIWSHDLKAEYGAQIPTWGVACSPLVDGNLLLVDVGGRGDYGVIAFNKFNGKVVWKSKTSLPGYSSPVAVSVGGVKQILFFTGAALISVAPENGKKYWSVPWRTSYNVNAATPIFIAPDRVFISSGYNVGGAVQQMEVVNGRVTVREIWKNRVMRNHFSSSILVGSHLYGFDEGTLRCVDVNDHRSQWAKRGFGKGALFYADGHLIVLSERGKLLLIKATPENYLEVASAQVLRGRCWTVPTLAGGKLYVRNQKAMLCLEFSASDRL
ncbi:MAG: PQQ-binding-like beta-propeller repeat protein [bacterium]